MQLPIKNKNLPSNLLFYARSPFFLAYSALASPPVLYKPALHHHADGHYHFNRLTDDTLGPNYLKVLTALFLPNGVTSGVGASSQTNTLAQEV